MILSSKDLRQNLNQPKIFSPRLLGTTFSPRRAAPAPGTPLARHRVRPSGEPPPAPGSAVRRANAAASARLVSLHRRAAASVRPASRHRHVQPSSRRLPFSCVRAPAAPPVPPSAQHHAHAPSELTWGSDVLRRAAPWPALSARRAGAEEAEGARPQSDF